MCPGRHSAASLRVLLGIHNCRKYCFCFQELPNLFGITCIQMLLKPCVLSGVESEGEAVSGCWALVWVLPQGPVRVQQTKTREMGREAQSPESGLMFNRDNMEWWERKLWAPLRVQWLASLGLGVWFLKRVPGRKNVNLAFFRTTSCLRLKGSWGAWGLHLLSWTDFKNKQLGALVLFLVVWLCPVQHYVLAC